jgi:hypothetical protein
VSGCVKEAVSDELGKHYCVGLLGVAVRLPILRAAAAGKVLMF